MVLIFHLFPENSIYYFIFIPYSDLILYYQIIIIYFLSKMLINLIQTYQFEISAKGRGMVHRLKSVISFIIFSIINMQSD